MRKWAAIISGLGVIALERGLDVSGIQNLQLAIALWTLGGALLLAGALMFGWPYLKKIKHKNDNVFPNITIELTGKVRTIKMDSFYNHSDREGIYYIITDTRFINRSPNPVVIEAKLRVMIGSEHWFLCVAESEPIVGLEKWKGETRTPIGKHLSQPINLEPMQGEGGYLVFFLEREDVEYLFEDEEYEDLRDRELQLEVKEHLSNTEKTVSITRREGLISGP